MRRGERFERDVERLRRDEGRFARVPDLTVPMRLVLEAIELCNGLPLSEVGLSRIGGGVWRIGLKNRKRVLRRLLAEGLIEVMGASPAVYRVTTLGKITRRVRG